ncbi:GmrSD restriction endonuclease domain-containing protein [Streptomyces sclerotialus]|uniref:GmrSD restriction endonuclease domain-containing protein n=1 Tax=Streptomyces sclerotialus TaxID=1957 RepID=UPI0004C58B80
MVALEESQGRTRGQRSVFERYQDAAADAGELDSSLFSVEVTADGRPTDIEREEAEEEVIEQITSPFDPEHIDIDTRTTTVDLLLSRLRNEMIDLAPDFQRKAGIWTDGKQSRLIESLLLRIPIPSFYAAEKKDGSWAIVDGIQRLTSIARFLEPQTVGADPLQLTGLEYLRNFDEAGFADLSGKLQIRLRETEVVVHVIRRGTPEPVMFNVFARINTGGEPLTRQEIRHALIPGRARTLLAELAETKEFQQATGYSVVGDRMADREMVLRFLAFRMTSLHAYKPGDFDAFLAEAMHQVNRLDSADEDRLRTEFVTAMLAAREIFGPHAFRKYRRNQQRKSPINKALFEAVAVNLASLGDNDREALRQADVLDAFAELMEDAEFERAISVGTGDARKVRKRFDAVRELFENALSEARRDTEQ